jgi:hypothetical protein
VSIERAGDLLGGMPRSSVYKLKSAAGTDACLEFREHRPKLLPERIMLVAAMNP